MKNKFFKNVISFIMVLALVSSLLPTTIFAEETKEKGFYIIHNNDTHSRTNAEAVTKGLEDYYDANNEEYLVLHAGDAVQGQAIASLSKGSSIVEIMNKVGYDYMTIGNHEFDFGFDVLLDLQKQSNFSYLSANVVYTKTMEPVFKAYDIKTLDNGLKVGIFGLTTPETKSKTTPAYVADLTFENPIEVSKKMVKTLQDEKCDVIILLAHIGLDKSSEFTTDMIANEVDGINVIVDGHSHTKLDGGQVVKNTTIVQTGEYGENVGNVKITVDKDNKVAVEPSLLSTDFETNPLDEKYNDFIPSKEVEETIANIKTENEKITEQVVGNIEFNLDGERGDVRTKETNLSSTIASSMLESTKADISLMNGGGIRASIEKGPITMGQLIDVLPFGNAVITKDIKATDIRKAIEHGVDALPETAGYFPHFAGINVVIDSSKPAGSRVVSVTMEDGTEFDETKTYTVAMNDFVGAGGDDYTMFADYETKMYFNTDADMFIDYINNKNMIYETPAKRLVDINGTQETETVDSVATETETVDSVATEMETANSVTTEMEKAETDSKSDNKYVVKKGDYLVKIATMYKTNWRILAEVNNISSPYIIYPEQVLTVK